MDKVTKVVVGVTAGNWVGQLGAMTYGIIKGVTLGKGILLMMGVGAVCAAAGAGIAVAVDAAQAKTQVE